MRAETSGALADPDRTACKAEESGDPDAQSSDSSESDSDADNMHVWVEKRLPSLRRCDELMARGIYGKCPDGCGSTKTGYHNCCVCNVLHPSEELLEHL